MQCANVCIYRKLFVCVLNFSQFVNKIVFEFFLSEYKIKQRDTSREIKEENKNWFIKFPGLAMTQSEKVPLTPS